MSENPQEQMRSERSYKRRVTTRSVTFTYGQCHKTVTQERFPAPFYIYCSLECKGEARRTQIREVMRRKRSKVKVEEPKKRGRPKKVQGQKNLDR